MLRTPECVYCRARETTQHVLRECHVARQFWTRVAALFYARVPVDFEEDRTNLRSAPGKLRTLLTATGRQVLWRARCRTLFFHVPFGTISPLVYKICTQVRIFLQREFDELGETAFEMAWCWLDVVRIRCGRLEMRGGRNSDF